MDNTYLGFGLITLALLSLWVDEGRRSALQPWMFLVAAALIHALWYHYLDPIALPFIALWFCVLYALATAKRAPWVWWLMIALAFALLLHIVPGFHRLPNIDGEILTPGALPYTQTLNLDKALVGLGLLALYVPLADRAKLPRLVTSAFVWGVGIAIVVITLSMMTGYINFEPKLLPQLPAWAWCNFFFTCLPEEALMRGVLQQILQTKLQHRPQGNLDALLLASIIFGLTHFPGGPVFMFLSTVAGLGYGYLYFQTRAIESSIIARFTLNVVHFLFFTYPALATLTPLVQP